MSLLLFQLFDLLVKKYKEKAPELEILELFLKS